jgi:hypothetical protein
MWETTALHVLLSRRPEKGLRFVVSHISRKTSEIWGTPRFLEGKKTGWDSVEGPAVSFYSRTLIPRLFILR